MRSASMRTPPLPSDEVERLASLRRLNILDTPPEERFDRITRLARTILDTPIALVALLDEERQWFKSVQGLDDYETSRAISFCGHAILESETMFVGDARQDDRFADNPMVINHPNIRMYAGSAIKSPEGHRIGTLCVIDNAPRELTDKELALLEDLGSLVEISLRAEVLGETERALRAQLNEAERKALIDPLTRLWNREMIDRVIYSEVERSARNALYLTVMMVDLDHFKAVNDEHGHLAGDAVLRDAAMQMRRSLRDYDSLGRYGGEEFLAVLPECDSESAKAIARRLLTNIRDNPVSTADGDVSVTASVGTCTLKLSGKVAPEAMVAAADAALYRAKAGGRDRHCTEDRIPPGG